MVLLGDVGHVEFTYLRLETVLVSVQDRCMVCDRCTIGLQIVLETPNGPLGDEAQWKLVSAHLETVLILTQDSCTVCIERSTGSAIVLDAPDGTHR